MSKGVVIIILGLSGWVWWEAAQTVDMYQQRIDVLERRIEQNETHPGFWEGGRWWHCYETHITERRK